MLLNETNIEKKNNIYEGIFVWLNYQLIYQSIIKIYLNILFKIIDNLKYEKKSKNLMLNIKR